MELSFNISYENEDTGELEHFNFEMDVSAESENDVKKFLEHMNDFENMEIYEIE